MNAKIQNLENLLTVANMTYNRLMAQKDPGGRVNVCHLLADKELTDAREACNRVYRELIAAMEKAGVSK